MSTLHPLYFNDHIVYADLPQSAYILYHFVVIVVNSLAYSDQGRRSQPPQ